jgi:hypothetical protein
MNISAKSVVAAIFVATLVLISPLHICGGLPSLGQRAWAAEVPLALGSGNTNYGGDYAPATAGKSGVLVVLSSLIKVQTWGTLATLPQGYRPAKRMIFSANNHDGSARVDVLPDGRILWIAGGKNHGWISLSGISFPFAP